MRYLPICWDFSGALHRWKPHHVLYILHVYLCTHILSLLLGRRRLVMLIFFFCMLQHVTAVLLRRCIFGLWIFTVILVCMPLCGFGLYFEEDTRKCSRFRSAHNFKDKTYAFLYFLLGRYLVIY